MTTPRKRWFRVADAVGHKPWTNDELAAFTRLAAHLNERWRRDGLTDTEACRCVLSFGDLARIAGRKRRDYAVIALERLKPLLEIEVESHGDSVEIIWPKFAEFQSFGTRSRGIARPSADPRSAPSDSDSHSSSDTDAVQSERAPSSPAAEGETATDPERWAPLVAGRWFSGDRRVAALWLGTVLPELEATARAEVEAKGGTFRDRLSALIHRYARNRGRIEGRRPAQVLPVRDWAARRAAAEGGDR